MTIKENRPAALGNPKLRKRPYDNLATTQRARILERFADNPKLSTMEAREVLGILHPSGRIMELRKRGHKIHTYRISALDSNGVSHRVGLYVYQGVIKEVKNG